MDPLQGFNKSLKSTWKRKLYCICQLVISNYITVADSWHRCILMTVSLIFCSVKWIQALILYKNELAEIMKLWLPIVFAILYLQFSGQQFWLLLEISLLHTNELLLWDSHICHNLIKNMNTNSVAKSFLWKHLLFEHRFSETIQEKLMRNLHLSCFFS